VGSIGRLTEDFVVKLQVDFPGTISTLFRTGDKFRSIASSPNDIDSNDSNCLICGSRIEEALPCSAYSARMISQTVSRSGPHGLEAQSLFAAKQGAVDEADVGCNGGDGACQSKGLAKTCCKSLNEPPTKDDWNPTLCYGCRVTLQDVGQAELMPESMHKEIHHRSQRRKMRQSVQQFLL